MTKGYVLLAVLCVSGTLARSLPCIDTLVPECRSDQLTWKFPDFDDATHFYQCGGAAWVMRRPCGAGTWFSFEHQNCVWPHQWVSPQPPTTTTTSKPTEPPTSNLPEIETLVPECHQRQLPWLWPNFADAGRFYQCGAVGWVLSMPCAGGLKFSFESQECVWPHDWVSPQPPTTTTTTTTPEPTPHPTPSTPPVTPSTPVQTPPPFPTTEQPTQPDDSTHNDPNVPTIPTSDSPIISTPVQTPPISSAVPPTPSSTTSQAQPPTDGPPEILPPFRNAIDRLLNRGPFL